MNLRREFELFRIKDSKTIKYYANRLLRVLNKIRLLGEELTNKKVVEKVLSSLPKRLEIKISSLEDSRDLI